MDNVGSTRSVETNEKNVSQGRRALLRAGWAIPVIAATPLMNTASAVSSVDCAALQTRLLQHISDGDADAANDIINKMIQGGCSY